MFSFRFLEERAMTEEAPRASGQRHCGDIRYSMSTAVQHHALCHYSACRSHSGAPLVGWAIVGNDELKISGPAKRHQSSKPDRNSVVEEKKEYVRVILGCSR